MKLLGYAIIMFLFFLSCHQKSNYIEEITPYQVIAEELRDSTVIYIQPENRNFILLFKGEEGYLLLYNYPAFPSVIPVTKQ